VPSRDGLLSGTIRKKIGLTITSTKGENEERTYSVEAYVRKIATADSRRHVTSLRGIFDKKAP